MAMLDFHITINSYNRPEMLTNLLDQINKERGSYSVAVKVYLDGCDYGIEPREYEDFEVTTHHGREEYYKLIMRNFHEPPKAKYYLKLDDDLNLTPHFFRNCLMHWHSEKEPPLTLTLLKCNRTSMWDSDDPIEVNSLVEDTNWVDLIFMFDVKFLRMVYALHLQPPVVTSSSGVARQITRHLRGNGKMYRVLNSLVTHGDHDSQMNTGRKERLVG